MNEDVLNIGDFREHLVIQSCVGVHVIPVVTMEKIGDGLLKFSDIDYGKEIESAVVREWLMDRHDAG